MGWLSQPWQRLATSTTGAALGDRVLLWKGSFGGDPLSGRTTSASGGFGETRLSVEIAAAAAAAAPRGGDGPEEAPAYAVLLTDLTGVWEERVTATEITQRQKVRRSRPASCRLRTGC